MPNDHTPGDVNVSIDRLVALVMYAEDEPLPLRIAGSTLEHADAWNLRVVLDELARLRAIEAERVVRNVDRPTDPLVADMLPGLTRWLTEAHLHPDEFVELEAAGSPRYAVRGDVLAELLKKADAGNRPIAAELARYRDAEAEFEKAHPVGTARPVDTMGHPVVEPEELARLVVDELANRLGGDRVR